MLDPGCWMLGDPTSNIQPPTPNNQLPTTNSQQPTPNSQLPTPNLQKEFIMRKSQTVFLITALFLFSMIGAGTSLAQEKTYVIGVENIDYLPHYTGENNQYTGFSRVLLDAFAQKTGCHFTYMPLPLNRLFREFLEGNVDFKYPDNPDWSADLKKDQTVYYSTPVVSAVTGIMVLPENKAQPLEQFETLGTMMGFTPTAYMKLIKEGNVKKTESASTDFATLLKMGMLKRVDGVYIAIDVGAYQLREILKKPDALVFNPNLPYDVQKYSLSSLKHPEIINEFNEFLVKEKAFADQLKTEYHIVEAQ
jgi:ABC-type amino acid transport substrate-binding protein